MIPRWRRKAEELFGLDLRSLALFRIALALAILGDLFSRSRDLTALYSDLGVLPRRLLVETSTNWGFSLNMLGGSPAFQIVLFCLLGIAALALLLGYRARAAAALCWVLLLSIQLRNPLVRQASDTLLLLYIFWGMFLPLGAVWSASSRSHSKPSATRVFSGASCAIILQICMVYWFAGLNKTGEAWQDGSALRYVLSLSSYSTPLGHELLKHPAFLTLLTQLTRWLELTGPCLLLLPFYNGFFRTIAVFLFLVFHLGLALTMQLGPFPYFSVIGWFAILPGVFWEKFGVRSNAVNAPETTFRSPALLNAVLLGLISAVLLWNLSIVNVTSLRIDFPRSSWSLGEPLSLAQAWGMFSPNPPMQSSSYQLMASTSDGSEVDLLDSIVDQRHFRWRKYLDAIANHRNAEFRSYLGQTLCREWNSHHPDRPAQSYRLMVDQQKISPQFTSTSERITAVEARCTLSHQATIEFAPKLFY